MGDIKVKDIVRDIKVREEERERMRQKKRRRDATIKKSSLTYWQFICYAISMTLWWFTRKKKYEPKYKIGFAVIP